MYAAPRSFQPIESRWRLARLAWKQYTTTFKYSKKRSAFQPALWHRVPKLGAWSTGSSTMRAGGPTSGT